MVGSSALVSSEGNHGQYWAADQCSEEYQHNIVAVSEADPSQILGYTVLNKDMSGGMDVVAPSSNGGLDGEKVSAQETFKHIYETQTCNNERGLNWLALMLKHAFNECPSSVFIDSFKGLIEDEAVLVPELESAIVLSWYKYPEVFIRTETIRLLKGLVQECGGIVDDWSELGHKKDNNSEPDEVTSTANWTLELLKKVENRNGLSAEVIDRVKSLITDWLLSIWSDVHQSELPSSIQTSLKCNGNEGARAQTSFQTPACPPSRHGNGNQVFTSKLRADAKPFVPKHLKENCSGNEVKNSFPSNARIFSEYNKDLREFFNGTPSTGRVCKPPPPAEQLARFPHFAAFPVTSYNWSSGSPPHRLDGAWLSGWQNKCMSDGTYGLGSFFPQGDQTSSGGISDKYLPPVYCNEQQSYISSTFNTQASPDLQSTATRLPKIDLGIFSIPPPNISTALFEMSGEAPVPPPPLAAPQYSMSSHELEFSGNDRSAPLSGFSLPPSSPISNPTIGRQDELSGKTGWMSVIGEGREKILPKEFVTQDENLSPLQSLDSSHFGSIFSFDDDTKSTDDRNVVPDLGTSSFLLERYSGQNRQSTEQGSGSGEEVCHYMKEQRNGDIARKTENGKGVVEDVNKNISLKTKDVSISHVSSYVKSGGITEVSTNTRCCEGNDKLYRNLKAPLCSTFVEEVHSAGSHDALSQKARAKDVGTSSHTQDTFHSRLNNSFISGNDTNVKVISANGGKSSKAEGKNKTKTNSKGIKSPLNVPFGQQFQNELNSSERYTKHQKRPKSAKY